MAQLTVLRTAPKANFVRKKKPPSSESYCRAEIDKNVEGFRTTEQCAYGPAISKHCTPHHALMDSTEGDSDVVVDISLHDIITLSISYYNHLYSLCAVDSFVAVEKRQVDFHALITSTTDD